MSAAPRMLLGGLVLFVAVRALAPEGWIAGDARPAPADRDAGAARDPERVLAGAAHAQDLARRDPVARQRLIDALRATLAAPDESDEALLARALALGLDRSDPVVRRRLANLMRLRAEATAWQHEPGPEAVAARIAALRDAERERVLVVVEHVFVERAGRDDAALDARAAELRRALEAGRLDPHRAGDPHPFPARAAALSPEAIASLLGARVASELARAPVGAWTGPLHDDAGAHLVRVIERRPAPSASDGVLRERARIALRAEAARHARDEAVAWLRPALAPEPGRASR